MRPETQQQVSRIVWDLVPELDVAGFRIGSTSASAGTGRLKIRYDASVDVPAVLVDAIAAVTRVDVDFVQGHTVSIADIDREHLAAFEPRRAPTSIEQLLDERA